MSTSVYTGLKPFNFIRKLFLHICVRKVAVHLYKVLEVMSTSVDTDLNPYRTIPLPKFTATFRTHCIIMFHCVYFKNFTPPTAISVTNSHPDPDFQLMFRDWKPF
jgi:hypothetical protein